MGIALLLSFKTLQIQQHGLDAPVPVGAYLNGVFPDLTPGQGSGAWILLDAYPNLGFEKPIFLAEEPGANRLLVAEQGGVIYAISLDSTTSTKTLFLDIDPRTYTVTESGLLSFAFHPRYALDSSYIYLFYHWRNNGTGPVYWRVSRFTVSAGAADPNSELVLIHQMDRANNHNGGSLFFGNDGFLYISVGDEGGQNNQYNNCQSISNRLYGGILRIDVDRNPATSHPILRQPNQIAGNDNSFTANYFIPDSNPFNNPAGTVLEEFYAIGLRNPYRVTYDGTTNAIWCGEVGQNAREEINLIEAGGNYEWAFGEGTINGPQGAPGAPLGTLEPPVWAYDHGQGNCVIGGYLYRGPAHPDLHGKYVFADNGSKRLWSMAYTPGLPPVVTQLMTLPFGSSYNSISSFGTDADGELYILKFDDNTPNGKIYRLGRQNPGAPEPPPLLSMTGAFQNLASLQPADFMIPYSMNVPFWSDAALKSRWLILPNDGTHNTPAERIRYAEQGNWILPAGAVVVKHFEIQTDESNPALTRRLETRFLVKGSDSKWYGITYRWRDDQTDAELLAGGRSDTLSISTPNGPRETVWYYPERSECLSCHNEPSGGTLGLKTRQLNKDHLYPLTGKTANQLTTFTYLGMFENEPDTSALGALLTSAPSANAALPLEDRARSYLDANCSSCHRPGTGVLADFDARLITPFASSGLFYALPHTSLGLADPRVIVPQDLEHSTLFRRLSAVHEPYAMPPMAKNLLDSAGVDLIESWISLADPAFVTECPTVNFEDYSILSYDAAQDQGDALVQDNGATLQVSGNAWKAIYLPYTIGPNTILEFDFRSTVQGEEHAIGFDTDNTADNQRFQLHGTQNGPGLQAYNTYAGATWQHFTIPVGTFFTGSFNKLIFNADHDAGPQNGNSYFRHVKLYEGTCNSLPHQRIEFPALPNKTTADAPFQVLASSSSGLPVSYSIVSGPASLSGNTVTLTGVPGLVRVLASQAGSTAFEPAPSVERRFFAAPPGKATGSGLSAIYYHDEALTFPALYRVDPVIDFYWGSGSPDPAIAYGTYSVAWQGELEPPVSGTYTFTATTDDGVRLWVNNQLIIDHWQDQKATQRLGTIPLTAWQRVPVRMEFYERHAYASARLEWASGSELPRMVIPQAFLYPDAVLSASQFRFTATPLERSVQLDWETQDDRSTVRFAVERSADGRNFEAIAQVQAVRGGAGQRYGYEDRSPVTGLNYYRIRLAGADGASTYSAVETALFEAADGMRLHVWPVPLGPDRVLHAELGLPAPADAELVLTDLQGRTLRSRRIEAGERQVQWPLGGLSPGVYYLIARAQGQVRMRQVLLR